MQRAGFYYDVSAYTCHDWFAATYQKSICPRYAPILKALNPNHQTFNYKSGTDTYTLKSDGVTPHPDGVRLAQLALQMGQTEESQYQHWAEETEIDWGPWDGHLVYPTGSRIEVYHNGHQNAGTRILHHYSAPAPILALWAECLPGYDGVFLDNCTHILNNWGWSVIRGGKTQESGLQMGTPAYNAWHWQKLRSALVQSTINRAPNIANYWTDDYVNYPIGQTLVQESVGNPVNLNYSVQEIFRRNQLAASKNVKMWMSSNTATGTPALPYQTIQYGILCLYLAIEVKGITSFHIQNWTGPTGPDWPQLVTGPALETAVKKLKKATSDPFPAKSTFPTLLTTTERDFEGGAVFVRSKPWNGFTDQVETFPRPPQMQYLDASGQLTKPDTITIPNGGGAILVRA